MPGNHPRLSWQVRMLINSASSPESMAVPGLVPVVPGTAHRITRDTPQTPQANAPLSGSPEATDARRATQLDQVTASINSYLQQQQRGLRFSVDEASGRIVVRVIDLATSKVVRQIPAEEMLALARNHAAMNNVIFSKET
jgi:flagellar protein FlaG